MAKKAILTKVYIKTKFVLVIGTIKGNFWDQKSAWVIIDFFSRKLVWFGIFWEQVPKIDKWGIIPTQFSPLNTNLLWKLKERFKYRIQKSPWCQIFRDEGNLKNFHMFRFFNFDNKSVFSDKNWVGNIPHMSIFGTCSQNIPNQTSLREKNR